MACSAQSAQIGGYFRLSMTGPSKGVLFFNFFIVSHVVTICIFDSMQVELLELFFFCSSDCWHELCITVINAQWPGPFLWHIIDFLKIFELVRFLDLHNKQKKCKFRKLNIFWWNDSMTGHYFLLHRYSIGMKLELSLYYWKTE